MNVVMLRGRLTAVPSDRALPDGSIVWSFDLSTPTDDGRASVPVVARGDDRMATLVASLAEGAELFVTGSVRRRFFRTASGTQSRTEIVATQVTPVGANGPGVRAWRQAWTALGADDLVTLRSGLSALPGAPV